MHADATSLNDLSGRIIGCSFTVLNALGAGFPEKIYENALAHERRKAGLVTAQQRDIAVMYDGIVAGEFAVDLLVEDMLLVELKSVKTLVDEHRVQCLNYVKATGLPLCLLLNFGNPRLEVKRVVHRL